MKLTSLKDNFYGVIDMGIVIMIGIVFAAMMVIAYIVWTLQDSLSGNTNPADVTGVNEVWQSTNASIQNVTSGFDSAVNLILIVITVFLLALAISALLMLRGRNN